MNKLNSKLIATLTKEQSNQVDALVKLQGLVAALEWRGDFLGSPQALFYPSFVGERIFSLRSLRAGGTFSGDTYLRKQLFLQALPFCDLFELELDRDADLFELIPAEKRILAAYETLPSLDAWQECLLKMEQYGGRYYKLVSPANRAGEELVALQFLQKAQRTDVIAYASGAIGRWTQILGPYLGSPFIYGNLDSQEDRNPAFSIYQLEKDYDSLFIAKPKTLYGIVGNPVFSSLSPRIHNANYRAFGLDALYLPFHITSFQDFWEQVVLNPIVKDLGFSFGGFTTVSPFKEEAFATVSSTKNTYVQQSKACNILVRNGEEWIAESSDSLGIRKALKKRSIAIEGLKVAIIGCGGAGRTIAAALQSFGAEVVLVNRSEARGRAASEQLGLPFVPLDDFSARQFNLVLNATPVGKKTASLVFDPSELSEGSIVADLVYLPKQATKLIAKAQKCGLITIDGKEILVGQVSEQFHKMTNLEMSKSLAKQMIAIQGQHHLILSSD